MNTPLLLAALAATTALPAAAPAAPLFGGDLSSVTTSACGTDGTMCRDLNGDAGRGIRDDLLNLAFGMLYAVSFDRADDAEPAVPQESDGTLDVHIAEMTMSFSVTPLAPVTTRSFDIGAADLTDMLLFPATRAPLSYWGQLLATLHINRTDALATMGWMAMVSSFGLCGTAIRRRTSSTRFT